MNINAKLLDSILEEIKTKHLTEKDCLKSCDINTSFLSDWKSGKIKSPAFDKIYRISMYLGLSLDKLMITEQNLDSKQNNLSPDQQELLDLYNQLDPIKQAEFKGELKGYLKAKNNQ